MSNAKLACNEICTKVEKDFETSGSLISGCAGVFLECKVGLISRSSNNLAVWFTCGWMITDPLRKLSSPPGSSTKSCLILYFWLNFGITALVTYSHFSAMQGMVQMLCAKLMFQKPRQIWMPQNAALAALCQAHGIWVLPSVSTEVTVVGQVCATVRHASETIDTT